MRDQVLGNAPKRLLFLHLCCDIIENANITIIITTITTTTTSVLATTTTTSSMITTTTTTSYYSYLIPHALLCNTVTTGSSCII